MQQNQITIAHAQPSQAAVIAQLIMQAMTDECCLSFVGSGQTLDDFRLCARLFLALGVRFEYAEEVFVRHIDRHLALAVRNFQLHYSTLLLYCLCLSRSYYIIERIAWAMKGIALAGKFHYNEDDAEGAGYVRSLRWDTRRMEGF